MNDNSLLRNSSLFIAYMGCVGWVSAYSYGWGTSFYYGFPWWVVGAGLDDVARSLLYAIIVMGILFTGWGIGILFFLLIKKRSKIQDLSFFRLFFGNDSNLLIVFYVQIMPDDLVMQLHRF